MNQFPLSLEERQDAINMYSDFHKDAHGFRPRGLDYSRMSDEQLIEDFKYFGKVCKENEELEQAHIKACIERWNTLVAKTISLGANDRKTALRWLFEGSDVEDGIEEFIWTLGFLYSDEGRALNKELEEIYQDYKEAA